MYKKKNCLLISQHFYPEEFIINDLVKKMINYNFYVITNYPSYPNIIHFRNFYKNFFNRKKFKNSKIYRVLTFPRFINKFFDISINYLFFIIFGILKLFFISKKKIDFIFVFATSPLYQALIGVIAKKIFKKKLIVWVQDLWPESLLYTGFIKNKIILKLLKKLSFYIYNSSDLLIAQSNELKEKISKQTGTKVVYLPNPSRSFLSKKKIKKNISIGYAGNFGKVQNLDKVIFLANIISQKNIKNIKFYLIGDGSEKQKLLNILKKKKINNVFVKKRISINKITSFYKKMDILLINSNLKGSEAVIIPSKLQAYLSTSKPIISFCEGSVKKIITISKAGINLSDLKPDIAAKKIINLTKNKNKMIKLGTNGKNFFKKNYELNIVAKKFNNIINQCL
ncbi:glycosyltransferase family 4 protein [Candidatus Pelagibacter sp. HIMB1715]|uniref:glycosyltransferase family 4 protein n=1 Tax=Candidatus Pelagibacter sp. HIMB1715 TaxID=3413369 RepID=UPI003F828CB2